MTVDQEATSPDREFREAAASRRGPINPQNQTSPWNLSISDAASSHLNALRGFAAIEVLLSHVRILFLDRGEGALGSQSSASVLLAPLTLGHEAVIAFFVLSGLLVGGGSASRLATGTWSWRSYATDRLVRLYVVLIPALLLTLLLDRLGGSLAGPASIYSGSLGDFGGALRLPIRPTLPSWDFVGNVFFQQAIRVRFFGSNGPLWSLANEFWYYVFFGVSAVLVMGIAERRRTRQTVGALALLVATYLSGVQVLLYLPIWALGIAISHGDIRLSVPARAMRSCLLGAFIFVIASAIGLAHVRSMIDPLLPGRLHGLPTDLALSLAVALALVVMLSDKGSVSHTYRRASLFVANISFTLYLVHFPLLVLLRSVLFGIGPVPEGPMRWLTFVGVATVAVLYAVTVWWLFERNTPQVRHWIKRRWLSVN